MADLFKVLVIDDSKFITRSFEQYTSRLINVDLKYEHDGPTAIKVAEEFTPDLIFLDYILEDIDGLSILKSLKSNNKTKASPVVMISSKENTYDQELAILHGADSFMQKPLKGTAVRDLIMDYYKNKNAQKTS